MPGLADNTSFYTGNTGGGFARAFDKAGNGDYVVADGGKRGVHEGLYLKLRAEQWYVEMKQPTVAARRSSRTWDSCSIPTTGRW